MVYTTPELIQHEIRAEELFSSSTTPSLDTVNDWIEQAESEINKKTGIDYTQSSVSDEVYDWDGFDNILRVDNIAGSLTLEYNDQLAGDTPNWVEKTEDTDYYLYDDSNEVEFVSSNFKPLRGKKRFRLSYTKGFSEVPGVVQRLATLLVSQRVVHSVIQNQAINSSGGDIKVGIIEIGSPSKFSVSSYQNTSKEIDRLFDKVIGSFKTYRISRVY